jgi:hypothetical protein
MTDMADQGNDLKETIDKIEALVKEPGFIYTLCLILLRDMFFDPEESADINWQEHLSFQEITFLVGLLVKHPIDLTVPTQEESANRFERTYELFLELHQRHAQRFVKRLEDDAARQNPQEGMEEGYRQMFGAGEMMAEPIWYSGSGAYDFQYLSFATQKYRRDERWILQNMGIEVAQMSQIAAELKKINERKFADRPRLGTGDFPRMCEIALSIFSVGDAELVQIAGDKSEAFINAFALTPGVVNARLTMPGQYNELQARPIISLPDGRYFIPVGFNLTESIYESPFYWMNADKAYAPEALTHRGDFAQDVTAQLLREVFGASNVFTEVKVEAAKGKTITDIDVLAIAGNKAVIAQVKSKRLTELARMGDDAKLVADFQAAIQDAYEQALLSRKAVIEQTNKLTVDGKEIHLSEKLGEAYILCVTLDHYPAVTHQVDVYLKKELADPVPIPLSIFDLDILAFYLKDQFEFLYYLRQRIELHGYFKADSEISLLGFHLKHKLFKDKTTDMEALDNSFAQLIDANFPVLRGSVPRTKAADKLYAEWKNDEFSELIKQVKATGDPDATDVIFFLYDLAGKGADELVRAIKLVKERTEKDHGSHDARMVFEGSEIGATVLCEDSLRDLRKKLLPLLAISKYRSKASKWLALGCVGGSPNLVDAIAFDDEPWKEDPALKDIVEKHFLGRGRAVDQSGKKIGRNDPCPCGSGKKWKKCHGAR